jgi:two-component system NtrC family sensor kinase
MTAPLDAVADLYKLVSELEQRLESSFAAHDAAIAHQAATDRENARLFKKTQEAVERQTATAAILKVIASSPSDRQPVFEAIAESAKRLLGGHSTIVTRREGEYLHLAALTGSSKEGREALQRIYPLPLTSSGIHAKTALTGAVTTTADMETDPNIAPEFKELGRARGFRSFLVVPMLREGVAIGTIGVSRPQPGAFDDGQVELLKTFADQAVIAIENARLFNETKEALDRQNASAAILRTIASAPGDAERALYQIAETSARLFGAPSATIHIAEGDGWAKTIRFGDSSKRVGAGVADAQLKIGGRNMPGTIVGDNRQVNIPDVDNVDPAIADWTG